MVVFRGKNGLNLGQIWVNFGRFWMDLDGNVGGGKSIKEMIIL